jgi:hypothetical protein
MNEPVDIRNKSRRVKNHILTRFLALADKVDQGEELETGDGMLYRELLMTFAKNVIARSVEHGGDPDNETPIPILNLTKNVQSNDGDGEGSQAPETD